MVVSLEEVKLFLKVDGDEEDTLITHFILSAEEICEAILRYELTTLEEIPATIKQAILFAVSNMYENRESFQINDVIEIMFRLLGPYRNDSW